MEIQLVMAILCLAISVPSLILSIYGIIIIKAMERSTHTVTWQPMNDTETAKIAELNDKFNKEIKEEADLDALGF
jgi:hypothetical protein